MQLIESEVFQACEQLAVNRIAKELEQEGFKVYKEYPVSDYRVDLFAEKDGEKRLYEFKIARPNVDYKENRTIILLKELARLLEAKFYLVMVAIPTIKNIEYDGLDSMLLEYFNTEETLGEIDRLSTHSTIEDVTVYELDSIEVSDGQTIVSGTATLNTELQYGSDGDSRRGDGVKLNHTFEFTFTATIEDKKITHLDYEIDTDSFYE